MDYDEAKTKLKYLYQTRRLTRAQYFKLVCQLRARQLSEVTKEKTVVDLLNEPLLDSK